MILSTQVFTCTDGGYYIHTCSYCICDMYIYNGMLDNVTFWHHVITSWREGTYHICSKVKYTYATGKMAVWLFDEEVLWCCAATRVIKILWGCSKEVCTTSKFMRVDMSVLVCIAKHMLVIMCHSSHTSWKFYWSTSKC